MRRLLIALVLSAPASARAFTQATTETGAPMRWAAPKVVIHLDVSAPSSQLGRDVVAEALDGAARAWNGADPAVQLSSGGVGNMPNGAPTDCWVRFVSHAWEHPANQLASTQLWAHKQSAVISGAVIEVNERDHRFSTDASPGTDDLQSVMTHELGHLLGLGHSADAEATMYPQTTTADLHERMLAPDDVNGVTTLYPDTAAMTPPATGCSMATHSGAASWASVSMLMLLAHSLRRRNR